MANDVAELARKVDVKPEIVEKMLATFRVPVQNVQWQSLEVKQGQEMTLDTRSDMARGRMVQLKPESLDDLREWMGVPQRIYQPPKRPAARPTATEVPALHPTLPNLTRFAARVTPNLTVKIPKEALTSISPTATMRELDTPKRTLLQQAARNLIYGDPKALVMDAPLYKAAWQHISKIAYPLILLQNITVYSGATLNISPSVASLLAFRIKIYKGGRIKTPSFVSIHCYSVEGGL